MCVVRAGRAGYTASAVNDGVRQPFTRSAHMSQLKWQLWYDVKRWWMLQALRTHNIRNSSLLLLLCGILIFQLFLFWVLYRYGSTVKKRFLT